LCWVWGFWGLWVGLSRGWVDSDIWGVEFILGNCVILVDRCRVTLL
jgi:hypothetical protein